MKTIQFHHVFKYQKSIRPVRRHKFIYDKPYF